MAEPLQIHQIATIPGDWLSSVSAGVLHFFEEGSSWSICNSLSREKAVEPPGGSIRDLGRCATCSQRLGVEHSRLDRQAEAARAREVEPPNVADWHLAKARHFENLAAGTTERFRKVHFLADAKGERIKAQRAGNPSGFGKVETPRG
jgi:hypothetical protein